MRNRTFAGRLQLLTGLDVSWSSDPKEEPEMLRNAYLNVFSSPPRLLRGAASAELQEKSVAFHGDVLPL